TLREGSATEQKELRKRQRRLLREREKLLQLSYADAIPLDLLKSEQQRIKSSLLSIEQRLMATSYQHQLLEKNLKNALELATNAQTTYITAPDPIRRQLNQALFRRFKVDSHGDLRAE